jgi:hypothetical protein
VTPIQDAQVVDALPPDSFLLRYLMWAKPQTDAPLAYHLGVALTLLAATAPADLDIYYAGATEHANLFTLIVGRSGEDRKSTAVKMGRKLLERAAPGIIHPEPGSEQGFVDSLQEQPTQLIPYSEFGSFLDKASKSGYFESIKTRYNEAFDCDPIGRTKANGKGTHVENPRVSLLGAVALPYLEDFTTSRDWTGGFMSRWLVIYSHRQRLLKRGKRPDPALDEWLVQDLSRRSLVGRPGRCLGLSDEADALFDPWFFGIDLRILPPQVMGVRARIPTMAYRCALLIGWDLGGGMDGEDWMIGKVAMDYAIRIVELHLQSLCAISESLVDNSAMRDRRKMLRALQAGGGAPMTFGALLKTSKLLKRRGQEVLETLLEEGTLVTATVNGVTCYALVDDA